MFESWKKADWKSLDGAHTAPSLGDLKLLGSAKATVAQQQEALSNIEAAIFASSALTPAAPLCIPFLLEIAAEAGPAAPAVLRLLGRTLTGGAGGFEQGLDARTKEWRAHFKQDPLFANTYAALRTGRAIYIRALDHDSAEMRNAASFLIAWLGEDEAVLRPPLIALVQREKDPIVLSTALLALGHLERIAKRDESEAIVRHLATKDRRVATAAALALAIAGAPLARVRDLLIAGSDSPALAQTGVLFFHGRLARAASEALARLGRGDAALVTRFTKQLATPESAETAACALLEIGHDTPLWKKVIEAIASHEHAFTPRVKAALRALDLPATREELKRQGGVATPKPVAATAAVSSARSRKAKKV